MVFLSGSAKTAEPSDYFTYGQVVASLPSAARPPQAHDFLVLGDGAGGLAFDPNLQGTAIIRLQSDGQLVFICCTRDSRMQSLSRLYVDGVRYKLSKDGMPYGIKFATPSCVSTRRPTELASFPGPFNTATTASKEDKRRQYGISGPVQYRSARVYVQNSCCFVYGHVFKIRTADRTDLALSQSLEFPKGQFPFSIV